MTIHHCPRVRWGSASCFVFVRAPAIALPSRSSPMRDIPVLHYVMCIDLCYAVYILCYMLYSAVQELWWVPTLDHAPGGQHQNVCGVTPGGCRNTSEGYPALAPKWKPSCTFFYPPFVSISSFGHSRALFRPKVGASRPGPAYSAARCTNSRAPEYCPAGPVASARKKGPKN